MMRPARTTSPPNASPIDWWPRQTPRIGRSPAKRLMVGTEMPASFGVQGPGDTTIASGAMAAMSSSEIASFRARRRRTTRPDTRTRL
jgi:hypothetical protein